MARHIIGIDPGINGGICICKDGEIIEKHPMPIIRTELNQKKKNSKPRVKNSVDGKKVLKILRKYPDAVVIIEDIHTLHQANRSGLVTLFEGLGIIKGISLGLFGKYYLAYSTIWHKNVLRKRDLVYYDAMETNINIKKSTLKAAQRIYPGVDFRDQSKQLRSNSVQHDGMYEAALMAEHGRKLMEEGHIKKEFEIKEK